MPPFKTRWNSDSYFPSASNGQDAGGGGGGPGEGGGANSQNNPDWGAFKQSLDSLGDTFGARLERELGTRLDALKSTVESGFQSGNQQPPPDPNEGFDFDAATPRQLYDHMMGQFTAMMDQTITDVLDRALAPYTEQINGLRQEVTADKGTRAIQEAQGKYKDFNDWGQNLIEAAKQHPTLSVEDLYHHVRAKNPARAKELDAKYNPPPPPPPRPFSIGPSSASAGSNGPQKPMSKNEAATKAYAEVTARHPGILPALEDAFGSMI